MSETPKWAVEAAAEAKSYGMLAPMTGVPEGLAAIIAAHSPVEALTEALEAAKVLADLVDGRGYEQRASTLQACEEFRNALALARGEK